MKMKVLIGILVGVFTVIAGYIALEPVVVDCGRLTVTSEETTSGDIPEYRTYEYGSREYEDWTIKAIWPSGQYKIIPFNPSMLSTEDRTKLNQVGKHELMIVYKQASTTLKIEVVQTRLFRIDFDTNGGAPINPITGITHGTVIMVPIPVRNGYRFMGWFLDVALSEELNPNTPITTSLTLHAKWEPLLS